MHDSGGGGGGSTGTNWYNIDVQVMWNWVNRDLTPHYEQASSWKKASELTGLYAQRLQAFRDRLAQTWKPETSKASEAFLTKLDDLIKSVKDIDTVAGANYQAAADIPNAISEAKYKLQPIYNEWQNSQTPEDADNAAIRAAGVMYTLSSDLSSSRTSLGPPAPYAAPKRATGGGDGDDYSGGGGGSSTAMPPVIPAVVPTPPPPPPPPPPGDLRPFPTPKGPELVELNPRPPGMPPPTPTPPPTMPPTQPGPVPPGPNVIKPPVPTNPGPLVPGRPPVPAGRPPVPPGMPPITPPGGAPPRGTTPPVIGGAPPGQGGNRGPVGARPNPVGGMIGGATGGAPGAAGRGAGGVMGGAGVGGRGAGGAAGAAGRGAMGAMGVGGGRPGQVHDEEGEHFDPDTQWDVAQGVAPVLDTPDHSDHIDPGPAIGLSR